MRKFLYCGEAVFVRTPCDGVQIKSSGGGTERIHGNALYCVPNDLERVEVEYLEFLNGSACPEKYCVTNTLEIQEERVVKRREIEIRTPFRVEEKVRGNYLEVRLFPDPGLPQESKEKSIVSVGGVRMRYQKRGYVVKLSKIGIKEEALFLTVSYGQIHYTRASSAVLPDNFAYLVGTKKIGERVFLRLTLFRSEKLSSYHVQLANRMYGEAGPDGDQKGVVEKGEFDGGLVLCVDRKRIVIEEPDRVVELFFEIRKAQHVDRGACGSGGGSAGESRDWGMEEEMKGRGRKAEETGRDAKRTKEKYVFSAMVNEYRVDFEFRDIGW